MIALPTIIIQNVNMESYEEAIWDSYHSASQIYAIIASLWPNPTGAELPSVQ